MENTAYQPIQAEFTPQMFYMANLSAIDLADPATFQDQDGEFRILGYIPLGFQQPPFDNWRAHHLFNHWLNERDYNHLDSIGYTPDLDQFLKERMGIIIKGADAAHYTGGTPEGELAFREESAVQFSGLMRMQPDDPVCISILPDTVCLSCQATAKGRPGPHCTVLSAQDLLGVTELVNRFDQSGIKDAYKPFLVTPQGETLGIVTTKRNLYLANGVKI